MFPIMFGIVTIIFFISRVLPADPAAAYLGAEAYPEQLLEVREQLGLNKPIFEQYINYIWGILNGDLGFSLYTGRPVAEDLLKRMPATFELAITAAILGIIIGIPLGVISATSKDKAPDHFARLIAISGISMPSFWWGLMLLLLVYGWLGGPGPGRISFMLTPPTHITGFYTVDSLLALDFEKFIDTLSHLIMPAFTLSFFQTARIVRILRSSMLEVLTQEYIRAEQAHGLPDKKVIYKHALKNSLIPTTTVIGLGFGQLLGGSIIVESVFLWPGIGKYAIESISGVDFAAVLGFTFVVSIIYLVVNLIVDLIYSYLDPRISY